MSAVFRGYGLAFLAALALWYAIREPLLQGHTFVANRVLRVSGHGEAQIRDLFEDVDVPYKTQLLVNSTPAGEQLVRHATRKNVGFICMGIRKKSKVGKLIFGSTVQYVILNAPCPVLTTG